MIQSKIIQTIFYIKRKSHPEKNGSAIFCKLKNLFQFFDLFYCQLCILCNLFNRKAVFFHS